jgi:hypothetical protein
MTSTLRARRGYLLLEVTIAGAIAALAVASLLTLLGETRAQSIAVARDGTARGIVARDIERARAKGFIGVAAIAPAVVTGVTGRYIAETQVVTGSEVLFNAQTSDFKDVTVVVTHPINDGTTTSEQATVRLYE